MTVVHNDHSGQLGVTALLVNCHFIDSHPQAETCKGQSSNSDKFELMHVPKT